MEIQHWKEKIAAYQAGKPPIADRLAGRTEKKEQERILWDRWKASGETDQQALAELFQSLAPLIRKISLNYQGNLPPAFIEGEVKKHVLNALKTYDPTRLGPSGQSIQMNTHIMTQTQKVLREIYRYQNPTRIAEESHLKVPTFQNITSNLQTQLGRPPTSLEIAREMNVGITEVERLRAGARRDLGAIEGGLKWKMNDDDRMKEILLLLQPELTDEQQQVLEYTFGLNGKPELKQAKQVAQRMGVTQARISQHKKKISEVLTRHFGGHKTPDLGN